VPVQFPFHIVLMRNLAMFAIIGVLIVVFVRVRPYLID